jgi:quinol monooxygenase YgiN
MQSLSGDGANLYGRVGQFRAVAGKRDELVAILREAVDGVRQAPGCMVYIVSTTPEDPDLVVVMEVWRNKDDHDRSLQNDAALLLIGRARPLIAGAPQGKEIAPVYGVGL